MRRFFAAVALAAALLFVLAGAFAQSGGAVSRMRLAFANPPDDARIMMRWWWFGPSVEKAELARELEMMKRGGIGGVEIQPVYPLALDDPKSGFKNEEYLSAPFFDAVSFANQKARALGLRVDITLGSGWPYGGPHIRPTEASSRLRVEKVRVAADARSVAAPVIGAGERLLASVPEMGLTPVNGRLALPVGMPATEVVFFIASRTGMQVKRPSVGAEGFVLDHLDRAALDRHLAVAGEPLLKAFGATPPTAVFSDSLEVYGADWSPDFLAEFQKRRGYDLVPHLTALIDSAAADAGSVRNDWGRTLTELVEERYLAPLSDWARQWKPPAR